MQDPSVFAADSVDASALAPEKRLSSTVLQSTAVIPETKRQYSSGTSVRNNPLDFSAAIPEVSPEWLRLLRDAAKLTTAADEVRLPAASPDKNIPLRDLMISKSLPVTGNTPPVIPSLVEVPEDWQVTVISTKTPEDAGPPAETTEAIPPDRGDKPQEAGAPPEIREVPLNRAMSGMSQSADQSVNAALSVLAVTPAPGVESQDKSDSVPETPADLPEEMPAEPQTEREKFTIDPQKLGSLSALPHRIILNEREEGSLSAFATPSGVLMLPLAPIAEILGNSVVIDVAGQKVKYLRSRDGAHFELDTASGEVTANGRSVGFLNEVGLLDLETGLFPANAVQVFSGLRIERDDERQLIDMLLDKRLRYVTGFELYVNGEQLPYLNPEPRSLGHVLLLPLRPIVEELGSRLKVSADGNIVTVERYQDNAKIALNLTTGLVEVQGKPVGTVEDMAYADRSQLLLPREAIASLTGTYVTVLPGSRRIDVDLDGELARIIHPGQSVRERAASSPPSVESVEAFYDSEHRASTVVRGHYSEYNLRFEYETPNTQGEDGFTPEWMQLFAESIDGWGLGIGDHNTHKRELSGVNASRIKGGYFYKPARDGLFVATAGKPQTGFRELDQGDSVPVFDGGVAGLRYYANGGDFDAGLAVRDNAEAGGYKAAVGSAYKINDNPDFVLGDLYQRTEFAGGLYEVGGDQSLGGRLDWDGRLEPSEKLFFSARTEYNSSEVVAGVIDEDTQNVSYEKSVADFLNYGVGSGYRVNDDLSFAVNHGRTLRGALEGTLSDDIAEWAESSSVGMSLRPFDSRLSPWTYFSWEKTSQSNDESVRRLNGQAVWRIDKFNVLLKHVDQQAEDSGKSWLTSFELSREPWVHFLQKQASLRLSPRLNAWKTRETSSANIGALLSFDSGEWLGRRTKLGMSYGKNLGVKLLENPAADEDETDFEEGADYFSAVLSWRFNRLLKFTTNYFSDLDGHDDTYATLTAYYEFNPPRHIKQTKENAGLLSGQVFLDENFDGIQQENEQGIAGARVKIRGTRVGLQADPNGRFTIQNLPVGVYRVEADMSQMPLGYIGSPENTPPVRIGDALISELKIPIVRGNQLSGVVYVDKNNNGQLDQDDRRLENIGLELDSGEETASTAFGQYTFDFLPPRHYTLSVQSDTLPDGISVAPDNLTTIDLQAEQRNRLLVRLIERDDFP
ncbi:MAG: hypothetical protein KDJ38_09970 [Gammaproteobacteria bacterium]|nr:hypothetical protein [Gammaproteobacteria bacterium]